MMNCKIILPPDNIYKLSSIPPSFDELLGEIHTRLPRAAKSSDFLTLKYMDAENELVTLSNQEDFTTAVLSCEAEKLKSLKVYVFITESPKNPSRNIAKVNCNGTLKVRVKANTDAAKRGDINARTPEKAAEGINKSIAMSRSAPKEGANKDMSLSQQQLEAIKDFVGTRVKEALEANIKNLLPGVLSKLKEKDGSPVNENVARDLSRSFTQELNQSLNSSRNLSSASFLSNINVNNQYNTTTTCTECKKSGQTVRYVCPNCPGYKSCESCEEMVRHEHSLLKLKVNEAHKIRANIKGNMKFSLPITSQSMVFTSGLKSVKSAEKRVGYKGHAHLQCASDQLVHVKACEKYCLSVIVKNIGKETWPETARLSCVNGVYRGTDLYVRGLEPGEKKTVVLELKAPKKSGRHLSQWRLYYEDVEADKARSFGESLFLEVAVEEKDREQGKEEEVRGECLYRGCAKGKEIMKLAEYLNEIFPGGLEEKVSFIEKNNFGGEMDMCKVVESYLKEHAKAVRGKKIGGCRPESNADSKQKFDYVIGN